MHDMMPIILEDVLDKELGEKFGYPKYDYRNKDTDNSCNGHSKKTMYISYGDMDTAIPCDRNGEHGFQLIKIPECRNTGHGEKILSVHAKEMTIGDMESHVKNPYGMDISDSTVNRITDKILLVAKFWQKCPLEEAYAVVSMDTIRYHVAGRAYCKTCCVHSPRH